MSAPAFASFSSAYWDVRDAIGAVLQALATSPWVVLFAPLAAFFAIALFAGLIRRRSAALLATAALGWAFVVSLVLLVRMLGEGSLERQRVATAWTWLSAGDFRVDLSIQIDPLSMIMMLVVTGIGFLIFAYSVGYMHGEREERRFFAYMSLFAFSMLLLVMSANFVLLLAGWGLVGLCSYLLIGYYWERPSAVAAAKKAFVMNAVGDVGITLAVFLIFLHTGAVDYVTVFSSVGLDIGTNTSVANWIALLLLAGAVAKSAQLPLQTWLPDAMEGPTPVSALIHAATMVTAGVYLIVRCWPLYVHAPHVSDAVAVIGALTLVMAGLIALVQTDIKRVIAYSTMSQIGYMFCAAGIGAYSAGMFQLVTHAFFKALLFLGAGIVIHVLAGEQDMRKMGGLARWMPYTTGLMWVGALALVGIPPFSGFFSKDEILDDALAHGGTIGYTVLVLGLLGAFLTGLYTFRLIYLVFHAPPSGYALEHAPEHTEHGEGPSSMLWPVAVLAVGSVAAGWLDVMGGWNAIGTFLQPYVPVSLEPTHGQELAGSLLAVGLGLCGILVARGLYLRPSGRPQRVSQATWPLPRILEEKLGFDLAYDWAFYRPAAALARGGAAVWEGPVIGGAVRLVAAVARWAAGRTAALETGSVRLYASAFAFGVALLGAWFVAKGTL